MTFNLFSSETCLKKWTLDRVYLWCRSGLMSQEKFAKFLLEEKYESYTSLSSAMKILQIVACLFCFSSLFGLLLLPFGMRASSILQVVVSLYILERFIGRNPTQFESGLHYGVQLNALFALIWAVKNIGPEMQINLYILGVCLFLFTVRYQSSLSALGVFGLVYLKLFEITFKADLPYPVVAASLSGLSFAVIKISEISQSKKALLPWFKVFTWLKVFGLILIYAPLNILTVREFAKASPDAVFGLFQILTYALPIALVLLSIRYRDLIMLRVGLLLSLLALCVFFFIQSALIYEWGLLLCGLALLLTSWILERHLARGQSVFTSRHLLNSDLMQPALNVLMLTQPLTTSSAPPSPPNSDVGGGSFAGGGASKSY